MNNDTENERTCSKSFFYENFKEVGEMRVFDDCESLVDTMESICKKFGENTMMSWRVLKCLHPQTRVDPKDGKEKTIQFPEFHEEAKKMTYSEFYEACESVAVGIRERFPSLTDFDLEYGDPCSVAEKQKKVGFYCGSRSEWQIFAHACYKNKILVTTAYRTLGIENVGKIVNETELEVMFCSSDRIKNLLELEQKNLIPSVKDVVFVLTKEHEYEINTQEKTLQDFIPSESRLNFIHFDEILSLGKELLKTNKGKMMAKEFPKIKSDDCCFLMYTSGSTGTPKGVLLSHKNVLSGVQASIVQFEMTQDDLFLAFLPSAHIMDQLFEHTLYFAGGCVGYSSVYTLSDAQALPRGDIHFFQPTVLMGVPRVFETMRKKITQVFEKGSWFKKMLFQIALSYKVNRLKQRDNSRTWPFDFLLFDKFKETFGGRLRITGSGASPLSEETYHFVASLVCPESSFGNGYGATECMLISMNDFKHPYTYGNVGQPSPTTEIKVVSVPELGYDAKDLRGELWVRSPCVSVGYFKRPELTEKAFTKDGWYKTGDIVQLSPENGTHYIKIIDRKRNIKKNVNGEYVSPENLEGIYTSSKFVLPTMLMVHVDSQSSECVAVLQPDPGYTLKYFKERPELWEKIPRDDKSSDYEQALKMKEFQNVILEDFKRIAMENKLANGEKIGRVILTSENWSPDNGLQTSTAKIKRRSLVEYYKKEIDDALQSLKQENSK